MQRFIILGAGKSTLMNILAGFKYELNSYSKKIRYLFIIVL